MKTEEKVLSVKRQLLPANLLLEKVACKISWGDVLRAFAKAEMEFVVRDEAEKDVSCKQIIPYVVFEDKQGEIVCHRRSGAEERLHGLLSLGIGGHISEADKSTDLESAIYRGMQREVFEETGHKPDNTVFCGIINEEVTEVGVVHIGFVFKVNIDSTEILQFGDELDNVLLYSRKQIMEKIEKFELWSQLAMEII